MSDLGAKGVHEILLMLEREWAEPRQTIHGGKPTLLALSVRLERAAEPPALTADAPPDVRELWSEFKSARLFEDRRFSQWGLVLVSPERSQELTGKLSRDRAVDVAPGDLVVGQFLGDSDLLIVRADSGAADYGSVLIALPLDPRRDWYRAGASLAEFLRNYASAEGAKFWEIQGAQA